MPITVVVGGQFGSEGKGKVSHFLAKHEEVRAVVRCGGVNSGHSIRDHKGKKHIFQQLPTAAIIPGMLSILVPGSYIDLEVLNREIKVAEAYGSKLIVDPKAVIMTASQLSREAHSLRCQLIGSTGAGMAEAMSDRISRTSGVAFAGSIPAVKPYLADTALELRSILDAGGRILIEGTQGFGLSLLHSSHYPYVTSRDTTAAAFVSEAGLSPIDVDDVVMVLRTYPIRVAGDSGPLKNEITWKQVTQSANSPHTISEFTTVTKKLRRVAAFDPELVRRAIIANQPSRIVLNHMDYIPALNRNKFVAKVQSEINRTIDWLGVDEHSIFESCDPINISRAENI